MEVFTGCTNDRNTLLMNQNDCQLWRLRQSFCGKKSLAGDGGVHRVHKLYQWYKHTGDWDSSIGRALTCNGKVMALIPGRSCRRTSPELTFCTRWFLFDLHSNPMLPQCHVKDPSHSAKSAVGRLQLYTQTPFGPVKLEWADYAVQV